MVVLGFVWLGLLVLEFVRGESRLFEVLGTAIWVVFLVDFAVKLVVAPRKLAFLRRNWLTALALALPALRVFRLARMLRVLRVARVARGARLVRVVGSINRGMKALGASMGRRGFGYVTALTALVTFAGAAGMYAFEGDASGGGLRSYGAALWWTAMVMTTMGSEYWPKTPEGRVLCFFLSLYAFAVLGYVTATLATFFVGRDAEDDGAEVAGAKAIERLRAEVASSRAELAALRADVAALVAEARLSARPPRGSDG
jgi:voltage-gated potassium channel